MLSLTCQTAIKAVIFLASRKESGEKAGIIEIAQFIDASEHTVGKIMQTLARQEVVNSTKGPSGGFYLSARQMNLPVIQIIDAIDGREIFKRCGLGLTKCSSTHPCPIHEDYKQVRDLFEKLCRSKKITDLCDPVNQQQAYLTC